MKFNTKARKRKYSRKIDPTLRARDKLHVPYDVCIGTMFTIFHLSKALFGALAHRYYSIFN
jgi:hypothetical protein